jgi:3-oxoacyl-[acyl-carrier protein] reductase
MELGLKNRTALVVGASKGIGKEICISLAKEGCKIISIARSKDLLENLNNQLNLINKKSNYFYPIDLINKDLIQSISKIKSIHPEISIIVNNVGGSLVSRNYLGSSKEWMEALTFNASIAIDVNSVFLPEFINRHDGRICHVSSISAEMLRGNPLYASAKAYLNAYVKTVGRAVAKEGVILNAVMPGAVSFDGSYWDEISITNPSKVHDFLSHHQAVNRFGTTEEIASVVTFLVSDHSTFMQGSIVAVDGGNM